MLCAHLLTRRAVVAKAFTSAPISAPTSASAPWPSSFNERKIAGKPSGENVEHCVGGKGKGDNNEALMEFLMMQVSSSTKRVKCVFMAR